MVNFGGVFRGKSEHYASLVFAISDKLWSDWVQCWCIDVAVGCTMSARLVESSLPVPIPHICNRYRWHGLLQLYRYILGFGFPIVCFAQVWRIEQCLLWLISGCCCRIYELACLRVILLILTGRWLFLPQGRLYTCQSVTRLSSDDKHLCQFWLRQVSVGRGGGNMD